MIVNLDSFAFRRQNSSDNAPCDIFWTSNGRQLDVLCPLGCTELRPEFMWEYPLVLKSIRTVIVLFSGSVCSTAFRQRM